MPVRPFASLGSPLHGQGGVTPARQVGIGLACVALAALARLAVEQVFGGLVPFLFTFPAVIAATLLGGARAGWTALIGCQTLTYAFVLPHWLHDRSASQQLVTFVVSTLSAGSAIWATAAFQGASELLRRQCERQVSTLSLLILEMDHRTKNNFQLAAGLLNAHGIAANDPRIRHELDEAASRLVTIASVYQSLSSAPRESGLISLREHLERICTALRASMVPASVTLSFGGDDVHVPSATALPIGLVVNEWVTNAIKYAFAQDSGTIAVRLACAPDTIRVEVRDDGIGMTGDRPGGVGSRLILGLAEAVSGEVETLVAAGTTRILTLPKVG